MARTQAERRDETRRRLLRAAADLFARRGVGATSVDTVAQEAHRTSGAVYAHFGGKDGLLLALLDDWRDATAEAITADFESHRDLAERVESLWRNFVAPPSDPEEAWVLLEHELWLYACRNPEALPVVAERYQRARDSLGAVVGEGDRPEVATLMIALLIGLQMQRRLDPAAVPDRLAADGLRALAQGVPRPLSPNGGTAGAPRQPSDRPSRRSPS